MDKVFYRLRILIPAFRSNIKMATKDHSLLGILQSNPYKTYSTVIYQEFCSQHNIYGLRYVITYYAMYGTFPGS